MSLCEALCLFACDHHTKKREKWRGIERQLNGGSGASEMSFQTWQSFWYDAWAGITSSGKPGVGDTGDGGPQEGTGEAEAGDSHPSDGHAGLGAHLASLQRLLKKQVCPCMFMPSPFCGQSRQSSLHSCFIQSISHAALARAIDLSLLW